MLGPLCDQVDKGYSFVKQNKVLKNYALFNNGQKNSHRNHTNRISYKKHLPIDQLIFASYMGRMPYKFVHFGGFLCIKDAGCRVTKSLPVLIVFTIIMFDHCFAGTCKISHERHKWNTFHIHVLNSTTYLTFINHTFDCESEVVVLIGKSHDLNRVTYKNGFKREHFCQRALNPFIVKFEFYHFTICLCILTCNDISTHIFRFWRNCSATLIIMHRVNYSNM